jgi:Flp pilus assembly protein TadD
MKEDSLYAEAHYLRGKALLGRRRFDEAFQSFIKARDLDICPLRCTSPLQDQIRRVAAEETTILIPFDDIVRQHSLTIGDKAGVPGSESFLDHAHPTTALHQLLAKLVLDAMDQNGLLNPARHLTSEERHAVFARGEQDFDPLYIAKSDLTLAFLLRWVRKFPEAQKVVERIGSTLDGDFNFHEIHANLLLQQGKQDEALKEYHRAVELSGNSPALVFQLAWAYSVIGKKEEAIKLLRQLVDQQVETPEVYLTLGRLYQLDGKSAEAARVLKAGLTKAPKAEMLYEAYAVALANSGRVEEALPWMEQAADAHANNAKALYNLAKMYCNMGKKPEALRYLEKAHSQGFDNEDALDGDRVWDSVREDPQFLAIRERTGQDR